MKLKEYTTKYKGILVLPLLIVPFLTIIFYAFGGGANEGAKVQTEGIHTQQEVNYQLPEADKSIRIMEKEEAYLSMQIDQLDLKQEESPLSDSLFSFNHASDSFKEEGVPTEAQLLAHIASKQMNIEDALQDDRESTKKKVVSKPTVSKIKKTNQPITKPIESREDLLDVLPELEQIFEENEVLQKRNDSLRLLLQSNQVSQNESLRRTEKILEVSPSNNSSFEKKFVRGTLIKAAIAEDVSVRTGNRVKIRLLQPIQLGTFFLNKNETIYGICHLNQERLQIQIDALIYKDQVLPIAIDVYDVDGMMGLYIPDNAARRLYEDVSGKMNSNIIPSYSDHALKSFGMQLTGGAAQSILQQQRIKQVHLRANSILYLKPSNE